MIENPLKNEDRSSGRRAWIIESAGEPVSDRDRHISGGDLLPLHNRLINPQIQTLPIHDPRLASVGFAVQGKKSEIL
jgi:hypothetical protein